MPARDLPARPNLEQYQETSQGSREAFRAGDHAALQRRAEHLHGTRVPQRSVSARRCAARRSRANMAVDSWPRFKQQIGTRAAFGAAVWKMAEDAIVAGDVGEHSKDPVATTATCSAQQRPQSSWNNTLAPDYERR